VSNLDRAGFLAINPGASLLNVSDKTILDWRETSYVRSNDLCSLSSRIPYPLRQVPREIRCGRCLWRAASYDLTSVRSNYFHRTGLQARFHHYPGPINYILQCYGRWWWRLNVSLSIFPGDNASLTGCKVGIILKLTIGGHSQHTHLELMNRSSLTLQRKYLSISSLRASLLVSNFL